MKRARRETVGMPGEPIVEIDALADASIWRREPYRLLFPAGIVLSWAGISHWLLHATGVLLDYRPIFHAITQIQGFMTCFGVGFLFTMIPRRTGSAPPAGWQVGVALVAPVVTVVAAWSRHWLLSQVAWLMLAATLVGFAVQRFVSGSSRRRPPNNFVWIPLALLMGIAGSVMIGADGWLVYDPWWHGFGRGLLLQGMFIGLVLGVGGLALPLMTRGAAPADAEATPRELLERAAHLAGGVLLLASFWIETQGSLRPAMLLRGVVILVVLLASAQLWRRPTRQGWNGRLVWGAAWLLPLGYLVASAFPAHYKASLHISFIGGFALLALAVSTQVTLGHGGYEQLLLGKPWQVLVIGALMMLAIIPRALMELDRARYFGWMAATSILFLAATLVWASFLLPKLVLVDAHGDRRIGA
ncbi:MAG: NnrS family protein [Acidobacteriota bacterium]